QLGVITGVIVCEVFVLELVFVGVVSSSILVLLLKSSFVESSLLRWCCAVIDFGRFCGASLCCAVVDFRVVVLKVKVTVTSSMCGFCGVSLHDDFDG
ncbi:2938_t:CDS:2, partial [Dentiscutata erythropus]